LPSSIPSIFNTGVEFQEKEKRGWWPFGKKDKDDKKNDAKSTKGSDTASTKSGKSGGSSSSGSSYGDDDYYFDEEDDDDYIAIEIKALEEAQQMVDDMLDGDYHH
jgi:hypothetical protein